MHSLAEKSPILAELASEWDFFGDSGSRYENPKKISSTKYRGYENPERCRVETPENPQIPGIRIYFFEISRNPEAVAL